MDDYTATLNGVTTGAGTAFEWREWPSGLGTAELRVDDRARPRRSGLVAGDDLYGGREIVFVLQAQGELPVVEQALTELTAAFAPRTSDVWLDLRITGTPAEYSLLGRPRGCEWLLSKRFTHHLGDARATFVATDPVKYGPEQSVSITLGGGGAGLVYPVVYPVVYGGSSLSGIGSAPNDGDTPVDWSATVNGPLLNPRLEHIETGRFVRAEVSLLAGESLVFDSRNAALLFDGSPRPGWQTAGSSWFRLQPGGNSLRLTADSGSGDALVTWRPGRA